MAINMKRCTLEDSLTLQAIGQETFKQTFEDQNTPESMDAYLEKAFHLK